MAPIDCSAGVGGAVGVAPIGPGVLEGPAAAVTFACPDAGVGGVVVMAPAGPCVGVGGAAASASTCPGGASSLARVAAVLLPRALAWATRRAASMAAAAARAATIVLVAMAVVAIFSAADRAVLDTMAVKVAVKAAVALWAVAVASANKAS